MRMQKSPPYWLIFSSVVL